MLSDITNSNSQNLSISNVDGSTTPTPSLLLWPYQPAPSKAAWKIWTSALHTMYASLPTSNSVITPLGAWIQSPSPLLPAQEWLACPNTLTLYHQTTQQWHIHPIFNQQWQYALYQTKPTGSTQSLPSTAMPATPYLNPDGDIIILYLPILPWNPPTEPIMDKSLDTKSDDDSSAGNPILT